jgi:hypothetical protein
MDLEEIRCEGVDRIHLSQGTIQWQAVVSTVMNFRIKWRTEFLDQLSNYEFLKKDSVHKAS